MPFTNSDIASNKLLSNSTPSHRLQHNQLNAVARQLFTLVYDAREYGAEPDSSSDESAHLQAAIAAAAAVGGGIVRLLSGVYLLSTQLAIAASNVILEGAGMGGTILRKTSGTAAPILIETNGADDKIVGAGVRRMTVDGNGVANYGIRVLTANYAEISQVRVQGGGTWQILMDCEDDRPVGGDARDNQHCAIRDVHLVATGSAGGIRLHGNSDASVSAGNGANSSYNRLDNILTEIVNGDAYSFGNTDNNYSSQLRTYRGSGSGRGLVLNGSSTSVGGHARHNQFFGISMTDADIYALAGSTQDSESNTIFGMSRDNGGTANPHISPGATLYWKATDNTGNM